jgi:peptide/nickel transport system permease protein
MKAYILRRILAAVPVVFLVTLIAFSVMQLVPGDPAAVIAGSEASEEDIAALRTQLGLDKPFVPRLIDWYGGLARGDLGQSILLQRPVADAIWERIPVTLSLAGYALGLTVLFGVAAGVIAAVNRGGWIDQLCMATALLGVSVPNFWLGIILIYAFSVGLGWFPTGGYVPFATDPLGWIVSLTLPAVSLALLQMGLLARITRSAMLEVLQQDYVRTARAKGLPPWRVIGKHALRNVVIPVVTVIGIITSNLVSGSVVIETVYSLPGLGRLVIQGIMRRDYPVIQGGLLVTAVAFVMINLIVDLLYSVLDPRIQLNRRE